MDRRNREKEKKSCCKVKKKYEKPTLSKYDQLKKLATASPIGIDTI